ncbi:SDR family NAD(P)-dependent oxidoreductase [Terricaulis silvestris]|uniref:D-xylose 1-dehydrogenase n=1 Tax=Terricaulis silvestris TaxID=2686094 RepID=A0A6I6MUU7_9CAUL|nr:SDR family NAD(P)-dependent oxidoreductase [Terricaulis silvestris]QGZ94943.1 3-oxoacyl-[acyl-carrier-protein] reductase FabG [Terricaulis silvestris]
MSALESQRFRNQVAIISGGARGLGLATAKRLAAGGARLALWDLDEAALAAASAEFMLQGVKVLVRKLDVTDADAVEAAAKEVADAFGRIDILVASAGITGPTANAWEYPLNSWRAVMNINLDGVFHCCKAVVPHMIANGYGRIVNVSSIGGKEGNAKASAYAASKGAVIAFTKALGKELAKENIRANCICPASIETELLRQMDDAFVKELQAKIPMGRPGQPEEVAALMAWMCSEECSYCTGAVFDCSGGRATY